MFCYQCEQTAQGKGCTIQGVCGKDDNTATLQDLLIYSLQGISNYAHRASQFGIHNHEVDVFILKALFTTITNVNFDPLILQKLIMTSKNMKDSAKDMYLAVCRKEGKLPETLSGPALFEPKDSLEELILQGKEHGLQNHIQELGEEAGGVFHLILYGLKGMAAYADHAYILSVEDSKVYSFFHKALDFLSSTNHPLDAIVTMALSVGEMNLHVMELLDRANTGRYGHPEPTNILTTPIKGKAILVSGHDLLDLEEILIQTAGRGLNVYTHGEMLPANAYPGLKKYPHLIGNYGSAWQNQHKEFSEFPGAILMTTNCIQKPLEAYIKNIFTSGLVAYPNVHHIINHAFAPVIQKALEMEGFKESLPEKKIWIGFGRNAIIERADALLKLVNEGKLKHVFLIGGCDGTKPGRSYYTELAQMTPQDTIILTLACGKYRLNKLELGSIDGVPRLLDVGQCNDSYSAVQVALTLAKALNTDVNHLPLSFVLSWYEQKAVVVLLSLLSLGIQNMYLGPSLPAFIKPGVWKVLQEKFNLKAIGNPTEDLKEMLEK